MTKGLKGVKAHSKVLSKKAVHGRIPMDFPKPSLVSQTYPDSRTIHPTAMENTLDIYAKLTSWFKELPQKFV